MRADVVVLFNILTKKPFLDLLSFLEHHSQLLEQMGLDYLPQLQDREISLASSLVDDIGCLSFFFLSIIITIVFICF